MSQSHHNKPATRVAFLAPDSILQSRYRIVRQLGKGGMGVVYEAIDLRLDHTVAIKQTLTSDEELWRQFEREARLMARLNHSVLPRVSDYFTEGNRAFLVMQYVDGTDLAEIIGQQAGPLPRKQVIAWADQLLDALVYLHSRDRQIIHRDIKPHNLKLTTSGQIALLDFGLAKTHSADAADGETCTSVFGYTPRYAPLEQIQDLGTDPRSDIYALGATLYHLLTGVKPPDALARAAALVSARPNPLKPADEVISTLGPELAAILTRAMEQNPNERYASAEEFRAALRQLGRTGDTASDRTANARDEDFPDSDEMTFVASGTTLIKEGLSSRTLAALFILLIVGFGVFCLYYPWKMPASINPAPAVVTASLAQSRHFTRSESAKSRNPGNAIATAPR